MEHTLPDEISLDVFPIMCETTSETVLLKISADHLRLGSIQIVPCPCGKESFVIGVRPKIQSRVEFEDAKRQAKI